MRQGNRAVLLAALAVLAMASAMPVLWPDAFAAQARTEAQSQKRGDSGIPPADAIPIALLVDISSGQVLHQREASRRFVPASITKTMSAFVAFEMIAQGKLDPAQRFSIRPDTWREWKGKGSTMWLGADDNVRVDDLLMGLMTVSANDAAVVLAEGAAGSVEEWAALMNAKAREIGMTDSHFANPNGWMDDGATFTSARDLARLAEAMIRRHPLKFRRYIGNPEFTYDAITQDNHDPMIGRVRGGDGIKTGFTNEAGFGFLGTAQRGSQRLVMVLAGADRSRVRDRWARRYIEWGFSAFERRRLFAEDAVIGKARVQGGDARSVVLVAQRDVAVNVPEGSWSAIDMAIEYDGPIPAPIRAGDRVATLSIAIPGMDTARIGLFAAEDVGEAGIFDRIVNGIARWLS